MDESGHEEALLIIGHRIKSGRKQEEVLLIATLLLLILTIGNYGWRDKYEGDLDIYSGL